MRNPGERGEVYNQTNQRWGDQWSWEISTWCIEGYLNGRRGGGRNNPNPPKLNPSQCYDISLRSVCGGEGRDVRCVRRVLFIFDRMCGAWGPCVSVSVSQGPNPTSSHPPRCRCLAPRGSWDTSSHPLPFAWPPGKTRTWWVPCWRNENKSMGRGAGLALIKHSAFALWLYFSVLSLSLSLKYPVRGQ